MRQAQLGKKGKKPRKKTEPLAEGIRKKRRPAGFFTKMSDDELVDYACGIVEEKGLKSRTELQRADSGLYSALRLRKLLDRVIPESALDGYRDWAFMSDERLVELASEVVAGKGLKNRAGLAKADRGLHSVLKKRKLLGRIIGFVYSERRDWASMSDEEIIGYTHEFMEKEKIKRSGELQKADAGLYAILRVRQLSDRVMFERSFRCWASMSDEEVVAYAQGFIDSNNLGGKKELKNLDSGLYTVLQRRRLLDKVRFGKKKRKHRRWKAMSDGELVGYAQDYLEEKRIAGRHRLEKADPGLYEVLRRRKLLDEVFASIEEANRLVEQRGAVQEVVDAMKEFDS